MSSEVKPSRRAVSGQRNPMTTVSLRNLRAYKVRLLLTIVSVLLGTAFVAGSFVFTDSLKQAFTTIFTTSAQQVDAHVEPRHDYDPGVPLQLARRIAALPDVATVQPRVNQPVVVISHGTRIQSGGAPSQGGNWTEPRLTTQSELQVPAPAAAAAGKVPGVASMTQLHALQALVDGHSTSGLAVDGPTAGVLTVPVNQGSLDVGPRGMAVAASEARARGWTLGSTHTVTRPDDESFRLTVRGIYADNQLLGPWLVGGNVYRALTPRPEWSDVVALIKAEPGTNLTTLRAELDRATASYYIVNVQDRAEFKGQLASAVNGLLGLLYGLLGLAIVIAVLGIVNTLALSVVERRCEIGMLRAVGMQRRQVRRTLYLESLLIAVFGAVLGLTLGLGYGALFTHTLRGQGLGELSVPWGQALVFLVVAALVGVFAALWPGIRAARTSPLRAISEG